MFSHCRDKSLKTCSISLIFDTIFSKVSTKLTEGNNLPYQETQIFKDVLCEFRKKVMETERPLISLKQLFPPTNEDRREIASMSKCHKAIDTVKV